MSTRYHSRIHTRLALSFMAGSLIPGLLFGQSAATPKAGRALAIEDYYRVKTVGAPEISPDGKSVAFAVSTRIEATNGSTSEVWLVPADGSAPAHRVSPEGA